MADAKLVRDPQAHMPIDAGAGVPAGIGEAEWSTRTATTFSSAPNLTVGRQVALETRISVGPAADEMAVDPDLRVVVHAVELDRDELVFVRRVQLEMLAIPADAAGGVAVAAAVLGAERSFDAPVVRQVDLTPAGVVERGHDRGGEVALAESPVKIKIHVGSSQACRCQQQDGHETTLSASSYLPSSNARSGCAWHTDPNGLPSTQSTTGQMPVLLASGECRQGVDQGRLPVYSDLIGSVVVLDILPPRCAGLLPPTT